MCAVVSSACQEDHMRDFPNHPWTCHVWVKEPKSLVTTGRSRKAIPMEYSDGWGSIAGAHKAALSQAQQFSKAVIVGVDSLYTAPSAHRHLRRLELVAS